MTPTTTLCLDFGNTRLKCAVFRNRELEELIVLPDDSDASIRQLVASYRPDRTILSSVIDHNPGLEAILTEAGRFHKLSNQSKLPFTTPVGKPQSIGADRLALVSGAADLYPGTNNLVIALGSAITYNFVNKKKEFIGGSISPGMDMRFRSLNAFTAKLPLVEKDWDFTLMGYDTRTNILSGVILGMAAEIDGMIENYRQKYHNFNAVLTGGDAPYFGYHLKNKIFADPNLIYKGLYAICEYNNV